MQMLCMEFANRVPDDISFIAQKIGVRPAVAGKAIRHLVSSGFLLEFAEDPNASNNNDLMQLMRTDRVPQEGEIDRDVDKDINPKGMKAVRAGNSTRDERTNWQSSMQPDFEVLTETCMSAGVRGSN